MAIISNVTKESRDKKREDNYVLLNKYQNRITITRYGKEAFDNGDYAIALTRYREYLQVVADVKEVSGIYSLRLDNFSSQQDLTEMMMISQIYFELARIFDAVPKYSDEVTKCLDQFLHFTINQPYQVINSELLRKHLKRTKLKNHDVFRDHYLQIAIQSKKCYIVTFSLGTDHPVTHHYRELKDWMLEYRWGQEVVRLYYIYSSELVERWQKNKKMHFVGRYFVAPLLTLFSKTILNRIIK